jgi:hypothetical protein
MSYFDQIIKNPIRTANTSVQASKINGGNLAQSFNLQNLRTVCGYVYVTPLIGVSGVISLAFINNYDNNPLALGSGDIIIAATVKCGDYFITNNYEDTKIELLYAKQPSYIEDLVPEKYRNLPIYVGGDNGNAISETISELFLGSGYNIPIVNKVVETPYNYVNVKITPPEFRSFHIRQGTIISITFLVLNPSFT